MTQPPPCLLVGCFKVAFPRIHQSALVLSNAETNQKLHYHLLICHQDNPTPTLD